ncbi:HSP20-like chaperone [Hyaloraphidium curvatum]|nr:HSP20-like chaperone [Hyaloraphidium curvatum]
MSLLRSPLLCMLSEEPLFNRLPAVFNDAFYEVARPATARLPAIRMPALDVREHEKEYVVEAEVPGVAKKDLDLSFNDNTLVIRGSVESSTTSEPAAAAPSAPTPAEDSAAGSNAEESATSVTTSKPANFWSSERVFGTFSRSFAFPTAVNAEGIEAKLDQGVLRIRVPKMEERKPEVHKIEIVDSA